MLPMMRRITEAPILMLSAKADTDDRVTGLLRGADDYIPKPFEMSELVARLHPRCAARGLKRRASWPTPSDDRPRPP